MKYAYSLTDSTLSVIINGRVLQTDRSNPGWATIKDLLVADDTDDADLIALFAPIEHIRRQINEISVVDGVVFRGNVPLHNEMSRRMMDVFAEGLDIGPWIKLAQNIEDNPSEMAREELYPFMEKSGLPMTPDGCLIAFKKVRDDYTDFNTGTFDNHIGQYVSMPREQVDPIRDNLCSTGLHFCSKSYLPMFGSNDSGARVVLINPRDVVSIPSDYDDSKGRTCAYEVVGELSHEDAQAAIWKPIESSYGSYAWGYDPEEDEDNDESWGDDLDDDGDDHWPHDAGVEAAEIEEILDTVVPGKPVEEPFVMSVSAGKVTPQKFQQLLKKYGSLSGMARALGMSAGSIQSWRRKLQP